jgi:hypothetical protein
MPSDLSKAKEPEIEGTLDRPSPSGAEVPTDCHTLNQRRHADKSRL